MGTAVGKNEQVGTCIVVVGRSTRGVLLNTLVNKSLKWGVVTKTQTTGGQFHTHGAVRTNLRRHTEDDGLLQYGGREDDSRKKV